MIKFFIIGLFSVTLIGCDRHTSDASNQFELPPDLADCKLYKLRDGNLNVLYITKCPSTTSTTRTGKNPKTVILIDGEQYEKVE